MNKLGTSNLPLAYKGHLNTVLAGQTTLCPEMG